MANFSWPKRTATTIVTVISAWKSNPLARSRITEDNLVTDGAATDANDYLIYDSSTGSLSYDADGNGPDEAVEVAVIGANLGLTSADFIVI